MHGQRTAAVERDLQVQWFSDCGRTVQPQLSKKDSVKPKARIFIFASWDTVYSRSYCTKMTNATLNQTKILAYDRSRGDNRRPGTWDCTRVTLQGKSPKYSAT